MKRLAFIAVGTLVLSGCIEQSNGTRVGQIVKVAREGVICPTWEIEMRTGGFANGNGANGSLFDFTIESGYPDDKIVDKLQSAADAQKEVVVSYRKEKFVGPCRSEHDTFLTGLRVSP